MNENLMSMLIIAGELLLALAILISVLLYRAGRRRRENESMARDFVESLKASENDRLARLRQVLKETYDLDDEVLEQNAETLMALERAVYTRFLKIFLGKDRQGLHDLHTQVENLLEGYSGMVPPTPEPVVDEQQVQELKATIENLEQENERLAAELEEVNESMEQMLREYVSVYGGTQDEARTKLAAEGQSQPSSMADDSDSRG